MHTMWKGTISFGLVNIPVKLHSATENKDIKLRNLHKECQSPIKYEKVCPVCETEVGNDDIVKGFEYTKNKFVVLEEEDLESIKEEKHDKAVEIVDFVQLEEIDPIYFERSYYLSPNEGGAKAYGLLRQALKDTGKIGLAKITIRSKEHLAVVRIYNNTLVMETIHYPDEVRDVQEVPNVPEEANVVEKELETAKMLIEQLTTEFEPEKYTDEYRTALLDLIEKKKEGEEIATAKEPEKPDNVTDLMEALEKSLDKTKKGNKKTTANKKKTTTTKTKKKSTGQKKAKAT
ncbi:non-homologous end joining protein Ku [Tenuibacillus multivorans]|uniref:Non-homologous end joining protein Ku n=1 Tax=Tenuibacillus multivorans TaxID=237069 RepID=A0A1H0EL24_9BACI|nr:Ku protein [Tenuibacillus multivorans]GEL77113.1 non-homologous end joining protein Ku [Tenuibacillus multivorans]SDN83072.1 DNA end-binding protein Ku [Tenuibacillus multivorans]